MADFEPNQKNNLDTNAIDLDPNASNSQPASPAQLLKGATAKPANIGGATIPKVGGANKPANAGGATDPKALNFTVTPIVQPTVTPIDTRDLDTSGNQRSAAEMLQPFPSTLQVETAVGDPISPSHVFLVNNSERPHNITASFEGPGQPAFGANAPSVVQGNKDSIPIAVMFAPRQIGHYEATMVLQGDGLSGSVRVPITGTATRPGTKTASAPQTENPSYNPAYRFLTKYFERKGQVALLLGNAASAAFDRFKIYTSVEPDRASSAALAMFEIVLSGGAVAADLAVIAGELFKAQRVKNFANTMKKIKEMGIEPIKDVVDTGKSIHELGESKEKQEKQKGQVTDDFNLLTINTMLDMTSGNVAAAWSSENKIDDLLDGLQYSSPSIDLLLLARTTLGEMPDPNTLQKDMHTASEGYEVRLYEDYYSKAGATYFPDPGFTPFGPGRELEDVPPKVEARLEELGKLKEFESKLPKNNRPPRPSGAF